LGFCILFLCGDFLLTGDSTMSWPLWKSVKYKEVCLRAYASVSEAKTGLARYFAFYNTRRPHSSLDRLTLDQFYFNTLPQPEAAKPRRGSTYQTGQGCSN